MGKTYRLTKENTGRPHRKHRSKKGRQKYPRKNQVFRKHRKKILTPPTGDK